MSERLLLLADLHHRTDEADQAIARARADRVVFLGDFQDHFDDNYLHATRTARWVRERMDGHPEDTFLFGNHDLPYAFGRQVYDCPGWTPRKHHAVNRVLEPRHWRRFQTHAWEQDWLLSHAGLARWLFPFADSDTPEQKRHVIDERCRLALERSWRGESDLVLSAVGRARGGRCEKGGVVWQCWSEFDPVAGIDQVVGHTPAPEVRHRSRPMRERRVGSQTSYFCVRVEDTEADFVSDNYCLDTHSDHFAILQDGQLTFHELHPAPSNEPTDLDENDDLHQTKRHLPDTCFHRLD